MFYDDDEDDNRINPQELPIYKKGEQIRDAVQIIGELIPENNNELQFLRGEMLANAHILTVKIVGAEASDLYDLKMEAATIIRKAAHDLMVTNHSLKDFGFRDVEYFQIVRDLIEEYRILFIDWVAGFDQWNYITDRWGLFNPPGVTPFDKDPDEDIPFNPFDEFD